MSFFKVGEPANLAEVAENALNIYWRKRVVLDCIPIPRPVPPQHLLQDRSAVELEVEAGDLEGEGEAYLLVRGSVRRGPKAGGKLSLHRESGKWCQLEVPRVLVCFTRGWTIIVEIVAVFLH